MIYFPQLSVPYPGLPGSISATAAAPDVAPETAPGHAIPGIAAGIDPVATVLLFLAVAVLAYVAVTAWSRPAAQAYASRFARALPNALLSVAVAAVAFQVVDVLEHMLQFAYLVMNPSDPAWLTPWAVARRDALSTAVVRGQGAPATPDELLHSAGNSIFSIGVVALAAYARLAFRGRGRHRGPPRATLWRRAPISLSTRS